MSSTKTSAFLTTSLNLIASESIRAWAQSAHNLPIITKMASAALTKNPKADPQGFATYLTTLAMGM